MSQKNISNHTCGGVVIEQSASNEREILYLLNFIFEEYIHTFLTSKIKSVISFVKLLLGILQNIFKERVHAF